jgi:tetratricopeptide (TPR) repeat protein
VLLDANDLDGALEFYGQALAIDREIGDHADLVRVLANMGQVHLKRGDFAPAAATVHKALEHVTEASDPFDEACVRLVLVEALARQGDVASAQHEADAARGLFARCPSEARQQLEAMLVTALAGGERFAG